MGRSAALQLERFAGKQTLNVRVPSDTNEKDLGKLSKSIIEVIRGHTGCNCLSGIIRVVLEDDMQDAIRVEF